MLKAQIHSKLPSHICELEDILTSDVFSFFYYSDRKIFLHDFLSALGLVVSEDDAKVAEFAFWPRFEENTEPDLVLIAGDYYILVESKFKSDFGKKTAKTKPQLEREIEGGQYEAVRLDKKFVILTITKDIIRCNEKFDFCEKQYNLSVQWINWQFISEFLTRILNTKKHIDQRDKLMAIDLLQTLDKKGLRNYIDLNKSLPNGKKIKAIDSVFMKSETIIYRGDFIGFVSALTLSFKIKSVKKIFYRQKDKIYFNITFRKNKLLNQDKSLFFS